MQSWNKADYSSSSRYKSVCLEMKCSKFWLNSMTYEKRTFELTIVLQQQHGCHRWQKITDSDYCHRWQKIADSDYCHRWQKIADSDYCHRW
jgi:L-rhamnose mutarotase